MPIRSIMPFALEGGRATAALLLLTAVGNASAVKWHAARQAADSAPEPASRQPEVEAEARRLIHLRDGRVLRAVSRRVAGSWEVRDSNGWQALPDTVVVEVQLERDALREARALAHNVDRAQPHQRIGYADWLVERGLLSEALEELDKALELDPDNATALGLLRSGRLSIALPPAEPSETFLTRTALLGRAASELAIETIRATEPMKSAAWAERLTAELESRAPARRSFAAHALQRLAPGQARTPLLRHALLDGDKRARRSASRALSVGTEKDLLAVVGALEHRSDRVRLHAAEALGHMSFAAAIPPLVAHMANLESGKAVAGSPRTHIFSGTQTAYVSDFDAEIAQGASIADPTVDVLASGNMLDARLLGVSTESLGRVTRTQHLRATRRSLEQLTGANPGKRASDWKRWLRK